jgi:hypothetical protein
MVAVLRCGQPKLLNKRDFQAGSGFPLSRKGATIRPTSAPVDAILAVFPQTRRSVPKRAIGWAKFRAYMG